MHMSEVKTRAEKLGLKPGRMGKADLIHAIQNREGNSPCFQTGLDSCDQFNCCWRGDCLPAGRTENKRGGKREAFLNKIKIELHEFNDKIDSLKMRANTMAGKKKTEALKEIKRLEKKCEEEIMQKMHEVTATSEDIWQSTRKSIESSWKELKKACGETLARSGSTKPQDHDHSL